MKFPLFLKDQIIFANNFETQPPLVSVVMPTYNRDRAGCLVPCIESVLAQTFTNFEFIIVDDGSSDQTEQVVTRFAKQDNRIVYIRHASHCGLPAVRINEGILHARAPYIAFIFDNNRWRPEALESLMKVIEVRGADLVYGEMVMAQVRIPAPVLGRISASLELMQNLNVIPHGAVLCSQSFFTTFGLYDPHLILHRICDWDLWLRALKGGAHFTRLERIIGSEHGLESPQSLEQTVRYEYKVAVAYLQDEDHQRERCIALQPEHISEYDVTDPEKVIRYLRSYNEWDSVERIIYAPFCLAHPEYEIESLIRHNRRHDDKLLGYRLNGSTPIFQDRQRILLITNHYTRVVRDWYRALSLDPQYVVLTCNELSTSAFLPDDLDQVVLFDCASKSLLPFLQQCRKAGGSAVYVVEHGMDEPVRAVPDPLGYLDLSKNEAVNGLLKASLYFAQPGLPWPESVKPDVSAIQTASDQIFRVGGDPTSLVEDMHPISFVPNGAPLGSTDNDFTSAPGAFYAGDITRLTPEVKSQIQTILERSPAGSRWMFFVPSLSALPEWLVTLLAQKKIALILTWESLPTLISLYPHAAWLVPGEILARYSSYHNQLMEEDLAEGGGVLAELRGFIETCLKEGDRYQTLWQVCTQSARGMREKVTNRGNGLRGDARQLHLQNILLGVALRKRIADWRGEPAARFVKSLVLVNSQLFGGSEMYGFLVAKELTNIGFAVRVCIPEWDQYGSGSSAMATWLNKNHLPPPLKMEYGQAYFSLSQGNSREQAVTDYADALSDTLDELGTGLVFCSGFVAEPVIARRSSRLVYMGLFPPWGYALKRMTFACDRINGLVSDSEWAAKLWGEWFAPPVAAVLSLIEPDYFTVRNQNLPPQPVCIAVVGTMLNSKRQKEVLLAVRALTQAGYDLRLNYYGSELDIYASYINELKSLAAQPPLAGRVFFNGYVEDPAEISQNNHLIVSASADESIPQGMMYNQAAGLVPVACPAGGIPEIVRDGETGFLARGFKIADIVEALQRAIDKRSDWPRIVSQGRQLLINQASGQIFVRKLLQVMCDGAAIHMAEGNALFTESSPDPLRTLRPAPAESYIENVNFVMGPDLSKAPIHSLLQIEKDNLAGIRLRLGTFHSSPSGILKMMITSADSGHVFRQVVVDAHTIVDNAWVQLSCEPLQNSKGQTLKITLTAELQEGRLALSQPISSGSRWAYINLQAQRVWRRTFGRPLVQSRPSLYPDYKNMDNS